MVNLGRGRFFLSAAIIPVANLMPSHSIAAVLAPTPRELILQHLATIRQEMVRVPTITGNNVLHHAVGEICRIGVQKLATLGHYYVAFLVRRDDHYEVIDIAGHSGGEHWEMQNDGSSDVTPQQFKRMYIPSQCDWLEGWPED